MREMKGDIMKRYIILFIIAALCVSISPAMRSAPKIVPPIRTEKIEYRAPHGQMGCVEAWSTKRHLMIWRRQIYVVKYDVYLETDVQDVYITSMELKDNNLIIKNERDSKYQLDLETLEVKVLEGNLIEDTDDIPNEEKIRLKKDKS
jgi:hypothetical protein